MVYSLSEGYTDPPRKVHCWIDYHERIFPRVRKQNGTIMSVYVYIVCTQAQSDTIIRCCITGLSNEPSFRENH